MGWWKRRNSELDEEIAAHLAMAERDLGSRSAARRDFGSEALVKEVTRASWGLGWAERLWQDVRFSGRSLRKSPGFAGVVVLTLALGIGANTAIYSIMRVVLRPVTAPDADRLVVVFSESAKRGWKQFPVSAPDFRDWQSSGIFTAMAAIEDSDKNVRLNGSPERVNGLNVTADLFSVIGIPARLGRVFERSDFEPGHTPVAVLSDGLWRTRFGADPSIVGRTLVVDGTPHLVIGVLPRSFPRISHEPIYTPLVFAEPLRSDRGSRHFTVLARLPKGVSLDRAQKRLDEVSARLEREAPVENAGIRGRLQGFEDAYQEDTRGLIIVLFGAVGFVLLIGCANIAGLVLARGSGRSREMTIRAALGAGGWRLARQLLAENMLLAVLGGAAAILPAMAAMRAVAAFHIDELTNAGLATLDWNVLAFNLALSVATGLLFGLIPAWQARRLNVADALKATGRSLSGGLHQRLRSTLVVVEIAFTLVLLVGAGLMLRTFVRLRAAWPGYRTQGVITMKVALASVEYAKPEQQAAFFAALLERVRALPAVRGAGAIDELPGSDTLHGSGLHFPDRPEARPEEVPIVLWNAVSGEYFSTMRIPLLRGRYLTDADREGTPRVAVIDDWTAKKYWPGQDAVGKYFSTGSKEPQLQVVGVVGNVDQAVAVTVLKGKVGQIYYPMGQRPTPGMALVTRVTGDSAPLAAAVREIVRKMDPGQPVFAVMTMDGVRAGAASSQRMATVLLGAFAALALFLAAVGVYGVVAYNVGRRTREFGIRMSLGARPADVLRMVARGGVRLTVLGVAAGLLGAFGLTRVLDSMLYGVKATDPATFAGVAVLLGFVAVMAAYVPARRATRVDPVLALREE